MRGLLLAMVLCLSGAADAAAVPVVAASTVTSVEVMSVAPAGVFAGVNYVRVSGVVHGFVDITEAVVGLEAMSGNREGAHEYSSSFELIAPAMGEPQNEVIYVDAENRGAAVSQGALGGFLQNHATSYARVQWQTGISAGVPATAQGVGLVIMRDFGQWLGGRSAARVTGNYRPEPYSKLMLGGISQSAWLVNTLIAEGFNVDRETGKGVYDAAIAIDGVGNWLAINQIGAKRGVAQTPYVEPDGPPLTRTQLLTRPGSDPLYIDVANYTDFYRLRAGLTSTDYSSAKFRRYDWPSPHAVGTAAGAARCNGGKPIIFNTLRYAPYMRALVLGMEKAIGVKAAQGAKALPPSTVFRLGPPPAASEGYNPLPGAQVKVPQVDGNGWPLGGVRFPEAEVQIGRPVPPAVPPAVTSSISATCGNFGGFEPFAPDTTRDVDRMRAQARALDDLVAGGYLLREDAEAMTKAPHFGAR